MKLQIGQRIPRPGARAGTLGTMILILPLLLSFAHAAQPTGSLTATLEPAVIPHGAQTTLQLRFQDCIPERVPEIPAVEGLQIRYAGQSRETTIVNGSMRSAVVLSYRVQAGQPGNYTIPSVRVRIDGQTLASQPVVLQVAQNDAQGEQAQPLILTLDFPKRAYFVGEATTATVSLFSRYASQRLLQLPSLSVDGAVVGTNVPVAAPQRVTTNNAVYALNRWQVPVTFVKTGTLRVSAEDCRLAVQFRSQGARDRFGFPSLFGEFDTREFTVSSPPLDVTIRPLPSENAPPEFTGAIGQFALKASISSSNVVAGDPLTLSVQLSGRGNLESLRWNAPSNWTGFRLYEPTSHLQVSDPLGQTGAKTIEQVIIPDSRAVLAVPPIRFAFFDPVRESFQTLSHPGFALKVMAASTPSAQPTIARAPDTETDRRTTDIVHIKSRPGHLALTHPPLIVRPGFLLLTTLPVLAWLLSLGWRQHLDRLAADPRHTRKRELARRLKVGLDTLRARARANQVQEFYSELFRLLQEVLGERLNLPAASITGEIVDQRLRSTSAPTGLIDATEALFAQCDQARYAPEAVAGSLESACAQAEQRLRELQQLEVKHAV